MVIDRYRCLSARSPGSRLGIAALAQAHEELRAGVATRCGIHAPCDPAALPADTGSALRLRAIWVLEHAIDDLIERHLRIARRALTLLRTLRQNATDGSAQEAAIRQADRFPAPHRRPRGPRHGPSRCHHFGGHHGRRAGRPRPDRRAARPPFPPCRPRSASP